MVSELKCPFCGAKLAETTLPRFYFCTNYGNCDKARLDWCATEDVWQALIEGMKAQRQLRTVKDRCAKKVKAKDKMINDCLQGIHVRQVEIESLQNQLQKTQSALKVAVESLSEIKESYCPLSCDVTAQAALDSIASLTKQENE